MDEEVERRALAFRTEEIERLVGARPIGDVERRLGLAAEGGGRDLLALDQLRRLLDRQLRAVLLQQLLGVVVLIDRGHAGFFSGITAVVSISIKARSSISADTSTIAMAGYSSPISAR